MRNLIALIGLIITISILKLFEYLFNFTINPFMKGWLCCMGWCISREAYDEFKRNIQ